MLALFKDENNQVDDKFLNTMYDTEEPPPTKEMDPYSKFGSLDPDGHELEDYDLKASTTESKPRQPISNVSTYQSLRHRI